MDREPYQYRLFKTSIAILLERVYIQRLLRYIFNAILVSVSVQIVLLPLLIIYFHRVSLSSVVLNIVVSLLLAILGFVALAALLVSHLSVSIGAPLVSLANGIDWIMVHGVDPFTSVGLASLRLPEYTGWSGWIYFLYYVPLLTLLIVLSHWRPLQSPTPNRPSRHKVIWLSMLFQTILLTTLLFRPFSAGQPDGNLHVDFLDVGQGDAALVTMPNGATLLVDGGGRPNFISASGSDSGQSSANLFERESRSIGEIVTSEYLWWRGLDSVDYVLATHADADHIDGLNDVVRNFSVRSALVARTPVNDAEYVKFAQTLTATNTPVEIVQAGDELHFGDVTATVLWPAESSDRNAPSRNNDSVVLRLQFGERSILLTGDIEKEGEAQILSSNKELHADVVKVPHHGSRTSSTQPFVAATSPRVAIVSVGLTSMFGHPHKEVVDRWIASGSEVLTTGRSGTISVTTDGKEIWVRKFVD
jgi:competence protein ComEC